ncbi:TVP38/TMEM64 family protein [Piscirickettsia salmonis]|uniref:TVP38/TMEM64 family protein n=1 Tax=Piscirickettsia salmonis TaxID=1238 RepID=UPI0007C9528C|nr:TVP38/TMEM64 family inner membrane protein YdjZ [Piscirickettsiaceae bacterium NZ-RLO1]
MKRFIPLFIIIITIIIVFSLGLQKYLSLSTLQEHNQSLQQFTHNHLILAILMFCLLYIASVTLSIPGATLLTISAGLLFGSILGTVCVVISATIGASLLFLAVRTSFGELLHTKAGPRIKQLEAGFQKNSFNYLLTLRLIPIFPFWLLNIAPALLKMPLKPYILATFLGIVPGSFVYVSLGNGLEHLLSLGKTPNLSIIFQPKILIPLIGLAILALLPIFYRKIKHRQNKS